MLYSLEAALRSTTHLSLMNHTKGIIGKVKRAFIKRRCTNLSDSNNTKILWSLTKSIASNFSNSLVPLPFDTNKTLFFVSVRL